MSRSYLKDVVLGIAGFLIVPALSIMVLAYVGQPALRWSYQWNGNPQTPIFYRCEYVSLTNQYLKHHQCPFVGFFPVKLWR